MKYLSIEELSGFLVVSMDRGKVNALEMEIVQEIRRVFTEHCDNDQVKGIILTGKPGYFSAGLDLIQLYDYDEEQIKDFFTAFGRMHIELVQFPKPFICAINGHSPAGGTVIAVAADYRFMCADNKYKIGLNEVSLNIQITNNLINAYNFWLGKKQSYQNIIEGKLLTSTEALNQGLVDQIAPMDEVLSLAKSKMKRIIQADPQILKTTKLKLRKDWIERLEDGVEEELEELLKIWWRPDIRMIMKMYIESFRSKKDSSGK